MLSEGGFVAEAAHFGHGLQMWLQIVWFLVRTEENNIVIFDEPDVYMHPDQQRKLLELVRGKFTQCILSTHATAILDECNEDEVIQLDRAVSKSVAGSRSKNDESKSNSHAQQVDGRVDADLAESWTIKIVVWDRESLVEIVDQHRKPVLCVYGEDSKGKPNEISIPQQPLSVRVHYPDNVDVFVDGDALDLGVFGDEFIVEFELAELVSNPSDH
jgi:ABC-type multidrug transport system ATPase subunit